MSWQHARVAAAGTHHELDGVPLYGRRFLKVQKFHEPGLAPVIDESGAFHITPRGSAAYASRFVQTWGFYEGLAAVEGDAGWMHIRPDGLPLRADRYAWCGNYQEGRCAVRAVRGEYLHLTEAGLPGYTQRYRYVGDFRDGTAVVRCPRSGLCTHILPDGRETHGRWFIDLDVFHKGLARARDPAGWFHIDQRGTAISTARFAEVEPFYNGQARVLTHLGEYQVVDERGRLRAVVGVVPRGAS